MNAQKYLLNRKKKIRMHSLVRQTSASVDNNAGMEGGMKGGDFSGILNSQGNYKRHAIHVTLT